MTRWGKYCNHTPTNHNKWKHDKTLIPLAFRADIIITAADPEPQPLDFDPNDNYDDWKAKEAEAASEIRLLYSPEVRRIMKGMRTPLKIYTPLETSLDTTGSYIGRQIVLHQFHAC
jgi:hypothetical protein